MTNTTQGIGPQGIDPNMAFPLLASGQLGLMFATLYGHAIQTFGAKDFGYTHEQIVDNANRLITAIWPNFVNLLTVNVKNLGQVGGIQGQAGNVQRGAA